MLAVLESSCAADLTSVETSENQLCSAEDGGHIYHSRLKL